jgi:hypothetical protein
VVYWQEGNGLSTYKTWRYRTENEASRTFRAEARQGIYTEDIGYFHQSSIADEFSVGCGNLQNFGYRCNVAARYQEYVINLNSIIDQEMSMEMFNQLVIFIDQEMERRLYHSTEN